MFELSTALADPRECLNADLVTAFRRGLSARLESPDALDDASRIDTLRALEELACVVSAAQAHLAHGLDRSVRAAQAAAGVPAARCGAGVAAQVAWARRTSPHRGARDVALARILPSELPATWRAWRTGRITGWKATLVARETACLSREDRGHVDAVVCDDLDRLEAMGERELVAAVQTEACRLDPASVVLRRRRAEADRHVSLRPAPDTMTWLTALLPVTAGVAAYAALTRAADSARADGDPRSKGQVMADALVARVVGATGDLPGSPAVTLGLVMTDHDLFGGTDEPAHLEGFGPVPAELAREVVVGALTRHEQVWVRRLYCHPRTGELVTADTRSRLFRGSMARFIRLRDRSCRTPWCEAPVRHSDHPVESVADGPTSLLNGQGLCEACNYAKQAPGWHARPSPGVSGHEVETTFPTGHRYRSRPPRLVATVGHTPYRVDYVLSG
ncbi:DUF222 domain-containing protein [Nocardioides cynanchi]|uniref:DUF222 domain-containing protein n=1 Tax=Nocardioides cynanchi TaxID=2558918 RepID=UPI00124681B7|nr:DUF222 domain-containing protein [Nocardioides cynanchi]